jgi:predicted alternative tryptophan synthase beta-subunit
MIGIVNRYNYLYSHQSIFQKPFTQGLKIRMKKKIMLPDSDRATQCYGADIVPRPSPDTLTGQEILAKDLESPGPLDIAISEALEDANEPKTILFNLSGHGHLDLSSYDKFFSGDLHNFEYPAEAVEEAKKHLPKV